MAARLSRLSKGMLVVTGGLAVLAVWSVMMEDPALDQTAARPPEVWATGQAPAESAGLQGLAPRIVFDPEGAVQPVDSDVLSAARQSGKPVLLRLQPGAAPQADPADAARRLADWIAAQEIAAPVTLLSYDWPLLEALAGLEDGPALAFATGEERAGRGDAAGSAWLGDRRVDEAEGSLPALVHRADGTLWAVRLTELRPEDVADARAFGLAVLVTGADDPETFPSLLQLRPDGIVTTRAATLLQAIRERPGLFALGEALD